MSSRFVLIGHDCPLGSYPNAVVPIGMSDGKTLAIYATKAGTEAVEIPPDAEFVLHPPEVKESLLPFAEESDRLFAYAPNRLVAYSASEEQQFFKRVLQDATFSLENPFLRFDLAKASADTDRILFELDQCLKELITTTPELLSGWYEKQRQSLLTTGLPETLLPQDPRLFKAQGSETKVAGHDIAKLLRSVGALNISFRPDLPFDLYFERSGGSEKYIRSAVQLKHWHRKIDEHIINRLAASAREYVDNRIVDEIWVVAAEEFTARAARAARHNNIQLWSVADLSHHAQSMNAFECLFIEAASAMIRLRPSIQLEPRSRHDFVRVFPSIEQDALAGVTTFAREYLGEILRSAQDPFRCILTFDLLGLRSDFPDWRSNPLHEASVRANSVYALAFSRKYRGNSPGAKRIVVLDPSRITSKGARHLHDYLALHISLGVAVAVVFYGHPIQSLASKVADYAHLYENLLATPDSSQIDIHNNAAVHWLWSQTALTAGQILSDPMASMKIDNELDISTLLERLVARDF